MIQNQLRKNLKLNFEQVFKENNISAERENNA